MQLHEICFLILVCGSFGALSLGLAVNTLRYHRWKNATARAASTAAAMSSRLAVGTAD